MIKFTCTANDCPNKNVDYNWENDLEDTAVCGGCGQILIAQQI